MAKRTAHLSNIFLRQTPEQRSIPLVSNTMAAGVSIANIYATLSEVLSNRNSQELLPGALDALRQRLQDASQGHLEQAYDSLMVPLVLLAQSVAMTHSGKAEKKDEQVPFPLARSDRVAERAIGEESRRLAIPQDIGNLVMHA